MNNIRILEMIDQLGSSLYSCITYVAYFLRVKQFPGSVMKLFVEVYDELCMDKVNEGISHIAVVLNLKY